MQKQNARVIENSFIKIAQFIAAGKTFQEAIVIRFGANSEAYELKEDATIVDFVLSYDAYG